MPAESINEDKKRYLALYLVQDTPRTRVNAIVSELLHNGWGRSASYHVEFRSGLALKLTIRIVIRTVRASDMYQVRKYLRHEELG